MNTFAPSGLHFQTPRFIAAQLKQLGLNCVRLNWSLELFYSNPRIKRIVLKAMYDQGVFSRDVRALEVLDQVVSDLASEQIMVILDNHMSDAGWYELLQM